MLRVIIILFLLVCPGGGLAASGNFSTTTLGQDSRPISRSLPPQEAGSDLREIVFSVAGQAISVKNGGVLALHPDTPFRVLSITSDSWFDFNLQVEIAGQPGIDLVGQVHTLTDVLGEDIYQKQFLDIVVLRKDSLLGGVRIMVRLLPIDWLRKAQASQDLEEQVFYLHKAYELAPDDRLLTLNLLDGLRRLGQLQQALTILRDYPNLDQDAEALKQRGYVYQAMGRLSEAIESFKTGLGLMPEDWDMTLALIELDEAKQMWAQAAGLLEELLEKTNGSATTGPEGEPGPLSPEAADLTLRLARAYSHIPEKIDASLANYEKYLQNSQANHLLWLELAQLRARAGQAQASLQARRQALSLAPDNRDMIMQLQKALQQESMNDEAVNVLKQGLVSLPEDEMLLLELIKLYRENKDNEGLIGTYRQYVNLHPQNYELHYYLAMMLEDSNRPQEAILSMEKALNLRPDYPDYLLALVRMKNQAGQVDEALEVAARLAAKEPANAKLWQELYALFGQSRAKDLSFLLDKALTFPEAQPKMFEMRAVLALNQKQPQQAAQILARAAERFPDDPRVLYLLGGIYEGLNQDSQALPVYEKILKLDPAYEDIEQRYLDVRLRLLDKR